MSEAEAHPNVFVLRCAVQTYAWGKVGQDSAVASLSSSGDKAFLLRPDVPYAELWMGTHPKGPSTIANTSQSLADWLTEHPEAVGTKVRDKFSAPGQLPFLFKVLSINKSLSIQAHPNKTLAETLHAKNPDKYPDNNHKPEMAIALTDFEGLCGFRPKDQILTFMSSVPELGAVVGESLISALAESKDELSERSALQQCFTALMTCKTATVQEKLSALVQRLTEQKEQGESIEASLGSLVLRLYSQFPGDVGCFCAYFLNHMLLKPGEAMFLEANLPHAYLSGDCIECMACSDNVVRAGLTPKFIDVPTLCSMLNYQCKPAEDNKFRSLRKPEDPCVALYDPPVPDFSVARIQVPCGTHYTVQDIDGASILLVLQGQAAGSHLSVPGSGLELHRGVVLFLAACQSLNIDVKGSEPLLMFRAYCEV